MSQFTVDQALQIAIQYQQKGQLPEAQDIYRQILEVYPDQADALHLMGVAAHQEGRHEEAEKLMRQALAIAPNTTTFRLSLGSVLQARQRVDDAITWYQETIAIDPTSADAYSHLGVTFSTAGRYQEAVEAFERALQMSPGHTAANGNLGVALCHLGQYEEALRALRTAISYQSKVPAFHASLAAALYHLGETEQSINACHEALALDPSHGGAHQTLSMGLLKLNRAKEAIEESRLAAEALPDVVDPQIIYGALLTSAGRYDDAVAFHKKALARFPQSAALHNNLANAYKDQGLLDEALSEFRHAMALDAGVIQYHSNYLFSLHFHPTWTPKAIFEEHRKFNVLHALPLKNFVLPHSNDRTPDRRLRIGYVSREFRGHIIGLNLLPLMANQDKSQFEVFCYSDVTEADFYTYRFQQCADQFVSIVGKNAQEVAELVRRHHIDILVDLNMHLAGERLLVFAQKPAPVQISFAAYPGTTGVTAIDYRLTDENIEPSNALPAPSSETAIRLPDSFWCYFPQVSDVAVNTLPAKDLGYITFGNLNNFCKLNESTFELWALVMRGVARSRLLMLTPEGSQRQRTRGFFEKHGIAPDRIDFIPRLPPEKYMRVYHRIDMGLDSFPYNGHNTSIDSFYMGAPVVTLIGDTAVSRAGWCQLVNLGLQELAAKSPSEFVRLATDLANDWPRLAAVRASLRGRMEASPLMDQKRYAANIEQAFRTVWRRWCEKSS